MMAGFVPRLVDVNPVTMNVDLQDLRKKITPEVRALFLVHLMGNPVNMSEVLELCESKNLFLLEDCCESIDAKYGNEFVGNFGVGSSFSFFFSHHITTMEGGMILTRDSDFAHRCRLLRAHGWARHIEASEEIEKGIDPRYTFVNWGFNVRPTELQAGFGLHQIRKLTSFNEIRSRNAKAIESFFGSYPDFFSTMRVDNDAKCSWFAFPVIVKKSAPFSREDITSYLEKSGVETRPIVAGNIARQPGFKKLLPEFDSYLPGADVIHEQGFYIGIHPIDYSGEIAELTRILNQFILRF
jgi:CDP-6-deoxy-D-xylo-4-hexulose-3-dehydrase